MLTISLRNEGIKLTQKDGKNCKGYETERKKKLHDHYMYEVKLQRCYLRDSVH